MGERGSGTVLALALIGVLLALVAGIGVVVDDSFEPDSPPLARGRSWRGIRSSMIRPASLPTRSTGHWGVISDIVTRWSMRVRPGVSLHEYLLHSCRSLMRRGHRYTAPCGLWQRPCAIVSLLKPRCGRLLPHPGKPRGC